MPRSCTINDVDAGVVPKAAAPARVNCKAGVPFTAKSAAALFHSTNASTSCVTSLGSAVAPWSAVLHITSTTWLSLPTQHPRLSFSFSKTSEAVQVSVDRTPIHKAHLRSTVCSQARNAHHALGSSHTDCSVIFVRL